jgi:hypothetical protein
MSDVDPHVLLNIVIGVNGYEVRTEGAGVRRRAHRSMASSRSGALKLTGRGAIERGEHREFGSGLTGARAAVW